MRRDVNLMRLWIIHNTPVPTSNSQSLTYDGCGLRCPYARIRIAPATPSIYLLPNQAVPPATFRTIFTYLVEINLVRMCRKHDKFLRLYQKKFWVLHDTPIKTSSVFILFWWSIRVYGTRHCLQYVLSKAVRTVFGNQNGRKSLL